MILLLLSFVAGILTILAPCTLPLLPVIIGSSIGGKANGKKALIIAISLGVSIITFTFILKVSTLFINVPEVFWQIISGAIILIFGLISLFPDLWERLPLISKLNRSSNKLIAVGYKKENFWGNIIIGASLGPVFSSCSPTYFVVLATVLPQSLLLGLVDLMAYAVGLAGMLLLVSFLGQKLVVRLGGLSDTHGRFRRTLGVIFIILGIMIMFGTDKIIETDLLSSGLFDVTTIEQKLLQLNEKTSESQAASSTLESSNPTATTTSQENILKNNLLFKSLVISLHGPQAPEIVDPSGFINTDGQPITISQFRGKKVVLLDIWTYSCINCQRTLPYVTAWYGKYKDQGLEVIGIHTPEFAFEKVQKNVEDAVKRFGITYPVVMDNDYATWNAYGNQYWPRKYLINQNGEIIYDHIGEGDYAKTELAIQQALALLAVAKGQTPTVLMGTTEPANAISSDESKIGSRETYFGAARNEYLGNGVSSTVGLQQHLNPPLGAGNIQNVLYLAGDWNFTQEYAENVSPTATIDYNYNAKNVYFVASGGDKGVTVKIFRDGKLLTGAEAGKDVSADGTVLIKENRLYNLVQGADYGKHSLQIQIQGAGLQAYTFTVG
ncbi:MAG: cytochrome c biogenesis protein DipZ [Candidatus Pacebacteria bacterium]|nr:cytochrome c biogenesis protein DipZ [Candidatus Paceibacterota bacterium]